MRLIDADALVAKCGDYYVEEGPEDGYIGTLKTLVDMQQTVEAYGWEPMDPDKLMAWMMLPNVTKPEWISVKDRLPEDEGDVLVYGVSPRGRKKTAIMNYLAFDADRPRWAFDGIWTVLYWMPLPEPPGDDKLEGKRDAEKRTHD